MPSPSSAPSVPDSAAAVRRVATPRVYSCTSIRRRYQSLSRHELTGLSTIPRSTIPWQVTGNHWLSLPCIHPVDGALYALGILHRGARAAVEFAGSARFLEGQGPPLLRPVLAVDGTVRELGEHGLAWERAINWLPTFVCTVDSLLVRGTLCAPRRASYTYACTSQSAMGGCASDPSA